MMSCLDYADRFRVGLSAANSHLRRRDPANSDRALVWLAQITPAVRNREMSALA